MDKDTEQQGGTQEILTALYVLFLTCAVCLNVRIM